RGRRRAWSELGRLGRCGESADLVVGWMNREGAPGVGRGGPPVVLEGRPVGCSDFAKQSSGGFENVGNLEGAADRDEFAPRNEDAATARQRRERQEHGGRVVVEGDRVGASKKAPRR